METQERARANEAGRTPRQHLERLEDLLNDLGNLLSAQRLVMEPFVLMTADGLSPDEVAARDGLCGLRDVIAEKMVEVWGAYNARLGRRHPDPACA